jgi:hypothetical protein
VLEQAYTMKVIKLLGSRQGRGPVLGPSNELLDYVCETIIRKRLMFSDRAVEPHSIVSGRDCGGGRVACLFTFWIFIVRRVVRVISIVSRGVFTRWRKIRVVFIRMATLREVKVLGRIKLRNGSFLGA